MVEFDIEHARMQIIATMNRLMMEFSELEKEIFYYDKKLCCVTSKLNLKGSGK